MIASAHLLPTWLWTLLHWPVDTGVNGGYGFWSGIGSGSPILIAVAVFWKKHNCHVLHCPWMHWKVTAAGDFVCKKHHPDFVKTHAQVLADHAASMRSLDGGDSR